MAKLDGDCSEMQIIPVALLHFGIGNYADAYWNLYCVFTLKREHHQKAEF